MKIQSAHDVFIKISFYCNHSITLCRTAYILISCDLPIFGICDQHESGCMRHESAFNLRGLQDRTCGMTPQRHCAPCRHVEDEDWQWSEHARNHKRAADQEGGLVFSPLVDNILTLKLDELPCLIQPYILGYRGGCRVVQSQLESSKCRAYATYTTLYSKSVSTHTFEGPAGDELHARPHIFTM